MGRFDPKFSDRQRQALIAAVIDESMNRPLSAVQAVDLASRGALGVPPFEVSLTQAREWIRKEKRNRAIRKLGAVASGPIEQIAEGERRRVLAIAHAELNVLERRKPGKVDLERLAKLTDIIGKTVSGRKPAPAEPPKAKTRQSDGKRPRALAERLAADAKKATERNGAAEAAPETATEPV